MSRYRSIIRAVQKTPWAILPEKLAEITAFLESRAAGGELPEPKAGIYREKAPSYRTTRKGTAVIPVFGTLAPRMNLLTEFSGGTSAEVLRAQVKKAAADPKVKSIVLDINSPGGSAYGIPEVADEVMAARTKKPVIAVANPIAASAAYWIASAASEVVATPSGEVGSIGVIVLHEDYSEQDKMLGIKRTLIRSGEHKAEANPFEPLSEEDREELQRICNILHSEFVESVARGRGLLAQTVREGFGRGRMVLAREALQERMVDRLQTFDQVLERIQSSEGRESIRQGVRMTIREFETAIRQRFGFTRKQARLIAKHGFLDQDYLDQLAEEEDKQEDLEVLEALEDLEKTIRTLRRT